MKKVRIGVIGNGIIGEHHLATYAQIPEAEVVALCDINEARMNEMGDKYGVERRTTNIGQLLLMDDIDAVDVCLHNNLHAPVSIEAMRMGKHVYCEKPMAGSFADAQSMYDAMEETGKKLGLTPQEVVQKEATALLKLRNQ